MRKGWIVETLQWIAKISSDFKDQSIEKSESSPYSLLESNLCVGEPDLWPVWSQSSFSSYLWTKFSLSPVYMVREMSSYTAVHWWGYNKGIVEKGGIVGRLAVRFLARTTYSAYIHRMFASQYMHFQWTSSMQCHPTSSYPHFIAFTNASALEETNKGN